MTLDNAEFESNLHAHMMEQRPFVPPLASEKLIFGRKIFFMDLKENERGRFIKVTEDVAGRRDTILVPIDAMRELMECLDRLRDFESTLPSAMPPARE